jgi:tetratricopeptide (TPR) repeat protein
MRCVLPNPAEAAVGIMVAILGVSAEAAAQDRPATDGQVVVLTTADASPMVALSIRPFPDVSDGSQLFVLVSVSGAGCRYPRDTFEVPVRSGATGFGLMRLVRAGQDPEADGSCAETLMARVSAMELFDLAAAQEIVFHLPGGSVTLPEEATRYVASAAPRTAPRRPSDAIEYESALENIAVMLSKGEAMRALQLAEAMAPLFRTRPPAESILFFATLARARRDNGDLDGAASSGELALMIADASGEVSATVAVVSDNLATVRRLQKRWEDATQASERALSTFERTLGVSDPSYGRALNNRAVLLADQGEYSSALEFSERALGILRNQLEPAALAPFLNDNRVILERLGRR